MRVPKKSQECIKTTTSFQYLKVRALKTQLLNSVRNKFDNVMFLIDVNLDFIAVVETKINQTFPKSQFAYI